MEKVDVLAKGFLYKLSEKKTFFFNESVIYPFVQLKGHKKGFFLSVEEYVEVLNYFDRNGLSRILVVSLYYQLFYIFFLFDMENMVL